MDKELKHILSFETHSSVSWYDWWNYWAPFIGIIIFIACFLFITTCFYSISSHTKIVQTDVPNEMEMEQIVNTLLDQKRLTL